MKKILPLLLFFTSCLTYSQELNMNTLINFREISDNSNLRLIIYYVPFSILTRSALSIEDVKRMYYVRIETTNINGDIYNFLDSLKNKRYITTEYNTRDLRAIIEVYYNEKIIFSYVLDGFFIYINNYKIQYDKIFYDYFVSYLPNSYEYDYEQILR